MKPIGDGRNPFYIARQTEGMANTIIILVVLGLILLFIFFLYLMARRTAQGFKEGMQGK